MTAWIWVTCAQHPPYSSACDNRWRFDVTSTAEALRIARASYLDAGELTAQVVIDCDKGECPTRLMFRAASTVEQARRLGAKDAGWFMVPRGRKVADHCQFHYEGGMSNRGAPAVEAPHFTAGDADQGALFDLEVTA